MSADDWLCFDLGGLGFSIEAPSELRQVLLGLFAGARNLPSRSSSHAHFRILPEVAGEAPAWRVEGPNAPRSPFIDIAGMLDALVGAVNLTVLDADVDALHLHASAVSRAGEAVLVVGASGSGKTTLAATLVGAGWGYVTDEMVRITSHSELITGLPKPLSVRADALDLLGEPPVDGSIFGREAHTIQIPASQIGATVAETVRPRLLLFCGPMATTRRGAVPNVRPISPPDAVVRLMGQTMDAERFGGRAVEVLSRMAASCLCYDLEVGVPAMMHTLVAALFAGHPEPRSVEVAQGRNAVEERVTTVFIGDEAVVHDHTSGQVLALDGAATSIWRLLLVSSMADVTNGLGPVESRFVSELASLRLLRQN